MMELIHTCTELSRGWHYYIWKPFPHSSSGYELHVYIMSNLQNNKMQWLSHSVRVIPSDIHIQL